MTFKNLQPYTSVEASINTESGSSYMQPLQLRAFYHVLLKTVFWGSSGNHSEFLLFHQAKI